MNDISLHILDIAENSINASAKNIEILVEENFKDDLFTLEIKDDGKGMNKSMLEEVTDPFITTRTTRKVGLGIPLLKQAAEMANGKLEIISETGKGTKIYTSFQMSHFDRQPTGNIMDTILALLASEKEYNLKFCHTRKYASPSEKISCVVKEFTFESKIFKEHLKTLGIENGMLLPIARRYLKENYNNFN
ncbi:MAG: sensor histidine kinase [Ignavibacteria bacterium]|nr:sensor histidine kinase [Ignavibacteria bacterium]